MAAADETSSAATKTSAKKQTV